MTTPTPPAAPITEGFSLSHAEIMDGETSFTAAAENAASPEWDIYGVNEASLEPDTDSYDNEGDDAVMSRWQWWNYAELSVQAGYVSFPLLGSLLGKTIEPETLTSGNYAYAIDVWAEDTFNLPNRPMLLKMPGKTDRGQVCDLLVGLYNVSFGPVTFEGPTYKEGLKINYVSTALMSSYDELGQAFADNVKRAAQLIAILPASAGTEV